MADTKPFLAAVKDRRSIYHLSKESTISDQRIKELVEFTIKNAPSSFNVQSARAVILLGDEHDKFWTKADETIKAMVPEAAYTQHLAPRQAGFKNSYGSVVFFEDEADLAVLKEKNPMVAALVPEWSDHSTGIHHFILWCAFEAEGLGCSLQHYSMLGDWTLSEWKLPSTWKIKAQLVFGKPTAGPREREYKPLEERVLVKT